MNEYMNTITVLYLNCLDIFVSGLFSHRCLPRKAHQKLRGELLDQWFVLHP